MASKRVLQWSDVASKMLPLGAPIWALILGAVWVPDRSPIGPPQGTFSGAQKGLTVRGLKCFPNLIYTMLAEIFGTSKKASNLTSLGGPDLASRGKLKIQQKKVPIEPNGCNYNTLAISGAPFLRPFWDSF